MIYNNKVLIFIVFTFFYCVYRTQFLYGKTSCLLNIQFRILNKKLREKDNKGTYTKKNINYNGCDIIKYIPKYMFEKFFKIVHIEVLIAFMNFCIYIYIQYSFIRNPGQKKYR